MLYKKAEEVLEVYIITAFLFKIKYIILIGDYKQLRL